MQHIRRVTAVIEREGDGYVALCPELDVAGQRSTNLEEALELFFETAGPEEVAEHYHPNAAL